MGLTGEAGKAWAGARTEGTRWAQNRGWKDRLGTDRLGGRARAISRGLARAGGGGGRALYRWRATTGEERYGEPLLEGSAKGPPGGCSRVGRLQAEQGDLR